MCKVPCLDEPQKVCGIIEEIDGLKTNVLEIDQLFDAQRKDSKLRRNFVNSYDFDQETPTTISNPLSFLRTIFRQ